MKLTEKQAWAYIEDQFQRAKWVDLDFLTPDGSSGMCDAIYALYDDEKIGDRVYARMLVKIDKALDRAKQSAFLYPMDARGAKLRVQFCRRRQKELCRTGKHSSTKAK